MTPISNIYAPTDYDKKIEMEINGITVWVDYDDVRHSDAIAVAASIFSACTYEMPTPRPDVLEFLGWEKMRKEEEEWDN